MRRGKANSGDWILDPGDGVWLLGMDFVLQLVWLRESDVRTAAGVQGETDAAVTGLGGGGGPVGEVAAAD